MPVIQQEGYVNYGDEGRVVVDTRVQTVAGLPERWGRQAAKQLAALKPAKPGDKPSQEYTDLCNVLDKLTSGPVPVDATYARICVMAATYAGDCSAAVTLGGITHGPAPVDVAAPGDGCGPRAQLPKGACLKPRAAMEQVCRIRGVEAPAESLSDEGAMGRMVDPAWWRKRLVTLHARAFEHAAMLLGFVSIRSGSYCSNETVKRRQAQNERNAAMLKARMLVNESGDKYSLYDLAAKGMANKSNRKGELMLRMAACEEVAAEMGHVGLFVTLTCPSKYHPVLAKTGTRNPKYKNATPREAQAYLNAVWARVRAANDRLGILPYGFRIAEPHHDGCPHWHMLVFLPRCHVSDFTANLGWYGCAEDADELATDAAKEARLKIIEIDPAKGTAAGYIAKYVGKNIDDSQGMAHDDEGAAFLGDDDTARTPQACERVDAWAATWGIRQFQGLGMPPVSVWRELRRVKEAADLAPSYVLAALDACQRRTCKLSANFCEAPAVIKAADFAAYIRAQGGVNMGRMYRIAIAKEAEVEGLLSIGRYGDLAGATDAAKPVGIYARQLPHLPVSKSTRYTWTSAGRKPLPVGVAVDFDGPWSPLNNCTQLGGAWSDGPVAPLWWTPEGVQSLPEMPIFTDDDRDELPLEWQTVDVDWWTSDEYKEIAQAVDEAAWEMIEQEHSAVAARLSNGWELAPVAPYSWEYAVPDLAFKPRVNTWSKHA